MTNIYRDIAERTGGDIYIAVAGPVRTGKSTFIKRFSELLMLPNIPEGHLRSRVVDELPQSGAGRTIMTTQPKFVPSEAVNVTLEEGVSCNLRLVDCVGYLIPEVLGHMDGENPRMVTTPWFDHDIPFTEAAEVGTTKVIVEHSTVCLVMTTDGSITEIPRSNYLEAEEKAINAAKGTGKPFVVVVNSTDPKGDTARRTAGEIAEKYGVIAAPMDVKTMNQGELKELLTRILYAFPLKLLSVEIPSFMRALPKEHPLIKSVLETIGRLSPELNAVGDYEKLRAALGELEDFKKASLEEAELGAGNVRIALEPEEGIFYRLLSEECGLAIEDDYALLSAIKEFAAAKKAYDRIEGALKQAEQTGYGVVSPSLSEMELLEPEIVRQGTRYGVRLRAKATGLHVIRVDIDTEVNPIVGTEEQANNLVSYLEKAAAADPASVWEISFFGKSLLDLVSEGMKGKLGGMPEPVQQRMQNTIERMVNNGCNGLICIML